MQLLSNPYLEFGKELIAKHSGLGYYYDALSLLFLEEAEAEEKERATATYVTNVTQNLNYLKEYNNLYYKNITFLTQLLEKKVESRMESVTKTWVEKQLQEVFPTLTQEVTDRVLYEYFTEKTSEEIRNTELLQQIVKKAAIEQKLENREWVTLVRKLQNVSESTSITQLQNRFMTKELSTLKTKQLEREKTIQKQQTVERQTSSELEYQKEQLLEQTKELSLRQQLLLREKQQRLERTFQETRSSRTEHTREQLLKQSHTEKSLWQLTERERSRLLLYREQGEVQKLESVQLREKESKNTWVERLFLKELPQLDQEVYVRLFRIYQQEKTTDETHNVELLQTLIKNVPGSLETVQVEKSRVQYLVRMLENAGGINRLDVDAEQKALGPLARQEMASFLQERQLTVVDSSLASPIKRAQSHSELQRIDRHAYSTGIEIPGSLVYQLQDSDEVEMGRQSLAESEREIRTTLVKLREETLTQLEKQESRLTERQIETRVLDHVEHVVDKEALTQLETKVEDRVIRQLEKQTNIQRNTEREKSHTETVVEKRSQELIRESARSILHQIQKSNQVENHFYKANQQTVNRLKLVMENYVSGNLTMEEAFYQVNSINQWYVGQIQKEAVKGEGHKESSASYIISKNQPERILEKQLPVRDMWQREEAPLAFLRQEQPESVREVLGKTIQTAAPEHQTAVKAKEREASEEKKALTKQAEARFLEQVGKARVYNLESFIANNMSRQYHNTMFLQNIHILREPGTVDSGSTGADQSLFLMPEALTGEERTAVTQGNIQTVREKMREHWKKAPVNLVYEASQTVETGKPQKEPQVVKEQKEKQLVDHVVKDIDFVKQTEKVVEKTIEEKQKDIIQNRVIQTPGEEHLSVLESVSIKRQIQESIDRKLDESLNQITSRVYRKLEERLRSERNRRGYQ